MMTAGALGLPYVAVKEDWLLPPENNNTERENARLRERITQLEKAEPQFKIELADDDGKTVEQLNVEHLIYEPLSESDIETFMDSLTNRFPMRANFSPGVPTEDEKGITAREWMDKKFASAPHRTRILPNTETKTIRDGSENVGKYSLAYTRSFNAIQGSQHLR